MALFLAIAAEIQVGEPLTRKYRLQKSTDHNEQHHGVCIRMVLTLTLSVRFGLIGLLSTT
jgi:hypothetical protein